MKHVIRPLPLVAAFASLGGAIALAHFTSAPWWIVPLGVIGPDLSFLAAIGGPSNVDGNMPPRVVKPYNLVHHPLGPTALLIVGVLFRSPTVTAAALAWGSHLLWDRGVGYGMRCADGTIIEPGRRFRSSSPHRVTPVADYRVFGSSGTVTMTDPTSTRTDWRWSCGYA